MTKLTQLLSTKLFNKKGFSITEMIVAAVIIAFLSLTSASVLVAIKKKSVEVEGKAVSKAEEEWLNGFLYKFIALGGIGVSYGILNIKDDNNKNFLDYYPDYHTTNLSAADKKRTFTLRNGKTLLLLAAKDNFRRISLLELFDYYYIGLLTDTPDDAYFNNCYLRQELNELWQNQGLILFYVPIYLRGTVPINMAHFPKKPAFLGSMDNVSYPSNCSKVQSHINTFQLKPYNSLGSLFSFNNPAPSGGSYANIKDFVLKSHLVAGQDVVIAGGVRILILTMENNKAYQCFAEKRGDPVTCNSSSGGLLFAENMEYIRFVREDVSSTQVKMSFKFLD